MSADRSMTDEWREAFVLEARLREVPGAKIGEALAEVDAHCADSRQRADEAFGDPLSYARALANQLGYVSRGWLRRTLRTAVPQAFATLGGTICVLNGVDALRHGTRGTLSVGQLVALGLGVVTIAAIVVVVVRPGRRYPTWPVAAAAALGTATAMLPYVVWRQSLVRLPGAAMFSAGLLLLALAWWPLASNRLVADPIVDPRDGGDPLRTPRFLVPLIRWSLPAILLLAVLVTMFLPG